ncbi:hypothetical protein Hypma_014932 [Hypsizygus marmoreus]|uniref:Uncharacterized protein n=1 Tax=Hypsizygus marmoreus TaxID=39966 RepID=A0A369KF97_HYPMA|nr:hypothetical protein Hypma_014932 [Hypsizygus marmoreus]
MQLFELAQSLSRTLVLPYVRKGRISACSAMEFGLYDLDSLEDSDISFRQTILPDGVDFHNALRILNDSFARIEVDEFYSAENYRISRCLKRKLGFLETSDFPHLRISVEPRTPEATGRRVVAALSGTSCSDSNAKITHAAQYFHSFTAVFILGILAITWAIYFPTFPAIPSPIDLRYTMHLTALAEQLAPSGPCIGIWGRHLRDYTISEGINIIWLMSDYPHCLAHAISPSTAVLASQSQNESNALNISSEHSEPIGMLNEAFTDAGDLAGREFTELPNE